MFALNENKVRYLVVGAYAVGYHAQPRVTKDLDLLVGSDAENGRALWKALVAFEAPIRRSLTALSGPAHRAGHRRAG